MMGEEIEELDARGLTCPLPVLKAQKRLKSMASGNRLRVLATDPKAPDDFVAFCEAQGHRLIERNDEAEGGGCAIVIERK
jgi:tRNA 2-thiouridine synthesizing protein A